MITQPAFWETDTLRKSNIETVQINIGNRCNQACSHCHIGASPTGNSNMDTCTARKILDKLLETDVENIEFTGGTPELNTNFEKFIEELSGHDKSITVRTSLTVLDMPEHSHFMDLYRKLRVKLMASLPSAFKEQTDRQRGKGVFDTSIRVLRKLNDMGYGKNGLSLNLVYNPTGDYLPPEQTHLEKEYKQLLKDRYGIQFNNLVAIVNSPIRRFKHYLIKQGKLDDYIRMLVNNFNHETLNKVMCRHLISVDYQGYVYDCDFNLALGIRLKGYEDRKFWEIDYNDFSPEITCDEHCYACTVKGGSSCHGVLIRDEGLDVKESVRQNFGEHFGEFRDCATPQSNEGASDKQNQLKN